MTFRMINQPVRIWFKKTRHQSFLAVLLAALILAACGGSEAAGQADAGDSGSALDSTGGSIDESGDAGLIPVDGLVDFLTREELTFGVAGKVGEIFVITGQRVTVGETLATLDATTIAKLERTYSQQRVSLDRAQEDLDDFQRLHQQEFAQAKQKEAKAGVAQDLAVQSLNASQFDFDLKLARALQRKTKAELDLDQAEEELVDFQLDYGRELAQARQKKAGAELSLDNALEDLANLGLDHSQALAKARRVTADAELALEQALDDLSDNTPTHAVDLANALNAKVDAEDALRAARLSFDDFEAGRTVQLALVNQTVAEATKDHSDADDALKEFIVNRVLGTNGAGDVSRTLAELQAAEESTSDDLTRATTDRTRLVLITGSLECREFQSAPLLNHCEQLTNGIAIAQANLDKAKRDLADLQDPAGNNPETKGQETLELQQLQAKIEVARANLNAALNDQDELEKRRLASGVTVAPATLGTARQREAVDTARTMVAEAVAALASADTPGNPADRQAKQDALASAQARLAREEKTLAAIESGADPLEVASVESRVRLLSEDLAGADREMDRLSSGPDPLKKAALEAGLAAAQSALAQAEDNLAALKNGQELLESALREKDAQLAMEGLIEARKDSRKLARGPDAIDLALLEAQVAQAGSALDDAREDLDAATIRAPFAGTVARINVDPDDDVTDESRIIEIVDPTVLEIRGAVDGTEVSQIQKGAQARVTIDSLPGQEFTGVVTMVSASPRTERGVVTYPVVVRVDLPQGVEAPLKISAVSVDVVAGEPSR